MKIKSLITARGNSKSIPNKNILDINNKPLIAYSIEASKGSDVIETWVSTDCKKIKDISLKYGAMVIERPKELATDLILNDNGTKFEEYVIGFEKIFQKQNYILKTFFEKESVILSINYIF